MADRTPGRLSIAITGAGGAGVISCGELLLKAWAAQGGRGFLRKAFGPQIRGGEAASLISLTEHEHYTAAPAYQLLVALDWLNFDRFEDEIRLAPGALVVCESADDAPATLANTNVLEVPFSHLATAEHSDGRANMLALGLLGAALELPGESLCALAAAHLAHKPASYRKAATACIEAGMALKLDLPSQAPARGETGAWCLTGNQAAGFGALDAGVRFVAAYPITPASDLLEWMAEPLEAMGGELLQAEDELAAINMALGAAFGGVPAFTATSGPGLALMSESIGLAVASETPVCVFNVQRGGPSTGIPTKSEQSDLNIALYGLHGDAPHLVLAPLGVSDCVFTSGWAVYLSRALQTAAIVLSDQFTGQSTAIVSAPRRHRAEAKSAVHAEVPEATGDYLRYRITESGVSGLAFPGDAGRRFTADGLEHSERGTPSAADTDHRRQLAKRRHKLESFSFGDDWAEISGDGELALIGFGSSTAVISEAAAHLAQRGHAVKTIALRLLAPLQKAPLMATLDGCNYLFVVEQNEGAQLYHYLRSELPAEISMKSYARPGPVPLNAFEVANHIVEALDR